MAQLHAWARSRLREQTEREIGGYHDPKTKSDATARTGMDRDKERGERNGAGRPVFCCGSAAGIARCQEKASPAVQILVAIGDSEVGLRFFSVRLVRARPSCLLA